MLLALQIPNFVFKNLKIKFDIVRVWFTVIYQNLYRIYDIDVCNRHCSRYSCLVFYHLYGHCVYKTFVIAHNRISPCCAKLKIDIKILTLPLQVHRAFFKLLPTKR